MAKKQIMRLCDPDPQGKRNEILILMDQRNEPLGDYYTFEVYIKKGLSASFIVEGDRGDIQSFIDTMKALNPNVEVEVSVPYYEKCIFDC